MVPIRESDGDLVHAFLWINRAFSQEEIEGIRVLEDERIASQATLSNWIKGRPISSVNAATRRRLTAYVTENGNGEAPAVLARRWRESVRLGGQALAGGPDDSVILGQAQRERRGKGGPAGRSRVEQLVDVLAAAMAEGLSLEGAERVAGREFESEGFTPDEREQVALAFRMTRLLNEVGVDAE